MKKLLKLGGRVLLGTAICGFSYLTPVSAMDDMAAFREAVSMPAKVGTNGDVIRESINLYVPVGYAKLEFLAQTKKDTARLSGALEVLMNDELGETLTEKIPFYVEQNKKDMTIYYKTGKQWEKFNAPSIAAVLADAVATPSSQELEKQIALVKDVKVLREKQYAAHHVCETGQQ